MGARPNCVQQALPGHLCSTTLISLRCCIGWSDRSQHPWSLRMPTSAKIKSLDRSAWLTTLALLMIAAPGCGMAASSLVDARKECEEAGNRYITGIPGVEDFCHEFPWPHFDKDVNGIVVTTFCNDSTECATPQPGDLRYSAETADRPASWCTPNPDGVVNIDGTEYAGYCNDTYPAPADCEAEVVHGEVVQGPCPGSD